MTCDDDHWQCTNQQCIPLVWRCDGDIDCHDNSDEQNCTAADAERRAKLSEASAGVVRPPTLCGSNQFQCVTSRECINDAWHCDGEDDCMDSSDEADCESLVGVNVNPNSNPKRDFCMMHLPPKFHRPVYLFGS